MIFSSWQFGFFILVLLGLFAIFKGHKARVGLLLIFSYIFYGAWDYRFIPLLLAISIISWLMGFVVNKNRKMLTTLGIIACILPLIYFKYSNFLAGNFSFITGGGFRLENIALPLGISFFTFQAISYIVDRYKNTQPICRNLWHYMLYIAFFPQLIAGPIVRAGQLLPQLTKKIIITKQNLLLGAQIFLAGMVQKLLVADNLSIFVDKIYAQPEMFASSTLWLAMVAFLIQIFCDFAGYSIMAIGLAKVFGITLPINFNMPYLALSVSDICSRWHLTLAHWIRDYIFTPLKRISRNVWWLAFCVIFSMLLAGAWHGANWTFILWGGIIGIAIITNHMWRAFRRKNLPYIHNYKLYKFTSWGLTFVTAGLLSVIFRGGNWEIIGNYFQGLFTFSGGLNWYHPQTIIILLGVLAWHLIALYCPKWLSKYPFKNPFKAKEFTVIATAILGLIMFGATKASPFVYFQF